MSKHKHVWLYDTCEECGLTVEGLEAQLAAERQRSKRLREALEAICVKCGHVVDLAQPSAKQLSDKLLRIQNFASDTLAADEANRAD